LTKELIDSSDIEKVLESTGLDNTRAALPARKNMVKLVLINK